MNGFSDIFKDEGHQHIQSEVVTPKIPLMKLRTFKESKELPITITIDCNMNMNQSELPGKKSNGEYVFHKIESINQKVSFKMIDQPNKDSPCEFEEDELNKSTLKTCDEFNYLRDTEELKDLGPRIISKKSDNCLIEKKKRRVMLTQKNLMKALFDCS